MPRTLTLHCSFETTARLESRAMVKYVFINKSTIERAILVSMSKPFP